MRKLRAGQKIQLEFFIANNQVAKVQCSIKRVEADRVELNLNNEIVKHIDFLQEGVELLATAYSESGVNSFSSIIIDIPPVDERFVIELPDDTDKLQRREYIRVPIKLNITITKNKLEFTTKTIDLSGGGLKFATNEAFKIGDVCDFLLTHPGLKQPIKGTGKVVALFKSDGNYKVALSFTKITEYDRSKILKICFEYESKYL